MSKVQTLISTEWVNRWAELYPPEYDDKLRSVHDQVNARGYYDRADLMAVAEWKLKGSYWPKHRKTLNRNLDDDIRDITRTALSAPLTIQHRVMGLLYGVAVPVASALLMVWNDKLHTVIDRRAVNSLVEHGMIPEPPVGKLPPYLDYLAVCQRISQRCGCDLRDLDRALYKANGNRELPPQTRAHA